MLMKRGLVSFACFILLAVPMLAGNGHMLHGFGPVNSSMGGATSGLALDPIGALMFNPALITSMPGNRVSLGAEFFQDDPGFKVELEGGNGDRSGVANPSTQLGVLPAIGWTAHNPESRLGMGFGLVAVAGFRTDSPADADSILFDIPPNGFGRIYTDYRVTRVPITLGYQVTPNLALGVSLSAYLAELAIAPLPHEVFDLPADGDDNERFYPQGGNLVSEMAFSIQLGFLYTVSPKLSIGGSITSEQDYDPFVWNSTLAYPDLDLGYGEPRKLEYDLDGPMNATIGLGYTPSAKTSVAFDVMWIEYDGVSGFGSPGGIVDRIVYPFGWSNVWVYKVGIQHQMNEKLTLRGGYNYSDLPIESEKILTATGAPALFQHHFSVGLSFALSEVMSAEMGFYYVPEETVKGPFPDLDNNVLGTMETSNSLTSLQLGLSWGF